MMELIIIIHSNRRYLKSYYFVRRSQDFRNTFQHIANTVATLIQQRKLLQRKDHLVSIYQPWTLLYELSHRPRKGWGFANPGGWNISALLWLMYVSILSKWTHVMCKMSGAGNSSSPTPHMSHSCLFPGKHVRFTVLVQEGESDGEPEVWVNVWLAMPLVSVQCELKCSTVIHQCLGPPDSKCFGEWPLHDHYKAFGFTKWSSALSQVGILMLISNLCLTLKTTEMKLALSRELIQALLLNVRKQC